MKKENKKHESAADPNLTKVIRMHERQGKKVTVNESATKYSALLLDLVSPYGRQPSDTDELDWLLHLGMIAWNLANVKKKMPETFLGMLKEIKKDLGKDRESITLLDKLIRDKENKLPEQDMFLHDFTMNNTKNGQLFITVTAKPFEAFMYDSAIGEDDDDEISFEEDEGYINRNAFVVKPKQPFNDWLNNLEGPQLFPIEIEEHNIYLVREMDSNKDIEKWLKKNFEAIFARELDNWHSDKQQWPQNRTHKMFCEWFSVEIHSMIYDLEHYPVEKDI